MTAAFGTMLRNEHVVTYQSTARKENLPPAKELTLLLVWNLRTFSACCYQLLHCHADCEIGPVAEQYFANYEELCKHLGLDKHDDMVFDLLTKCGKWCRERGLEIRPMKHCSATSNDCRYVEPREMHKDMCEYLDKWHELQKKFKNPANMNLK